MYVNPPENCPIIAGDSCRYKKGVTPGDVGLRMLHQMLHFWQTSHPTNQRSEEVRVTSSANAKTSFLFQRWKRQKRFAWRGTGIKLFRFRQRNRAKGTRVKRHMWRDGHGPATVGPICVVLVLPIPSSCHGAATDVRRNSIRLPKTTKHASPRTSIRDCDAARAAGIKGVVMETYSQRRLSECPALVIMRRPDSERHRLRAAAISRRILFTEQNRTQRGRIERRTEWRVLSRWPLPHIPSGALTKDQRRQEGGVQTTGP